MDEAQSFSDELLEEIRLLANTETSTEKLLPLVLAGQPELKDRLNQPGLRQLKQRVTLRCEIGRFSQRETAGYIAHRIRTAGGEASRLFTREAVMLIHERSGGIPRTISVICDNALLTGLALERQPVDSAVVLEVARDFDLGRRVLADVNFGIPAYTAHAPADHNAAFMPEATPPETPQETELRETASRVADAMPQSATSLKTTSEPSPEDAPELSARSSGKIRRFSLFGDR
jgi:hypothetical protein